MKLQPGGFWEVALIIGGVLLFIAVLFIVVGVFGPAALDWLVHFSNMIPRPPAHWRNIN